MNKLKLILFSLVIFPICYDGISQTKNQVELYFAPSISSMDNHEFADKYISVGFRFDIGVSYMRHIKQNARIGTGISYSIMGDNYFRSYPNSIVNPGSTSNFESKSYINFIELPFKFSYQIGNNPDNSFYFDLDLINQLLISTLIQYNDDGYEFEEKVSFDELRDNDKRVYYLAIQFGTTYQKSFANNLFLGLSPFFKYGLMWDNHYWKTGLKIALGYKY